METNYAKRTYKYREHHRRFKTRVTSQVPRLVCQECHGRGGETMILLDDGTGPWETCGWCQGTGLMIPWVRGQWLTLKRKEKRRER